MEQDERERALLKFRNDSANFNYLPIWLPEGWIFQEVESIVHYQLPQKKTLSSTETEEPECMPKVLRI